MRPIHWIQGKPLRRRFGTRRLGNNRIYDINIKVYTEDRIMWRWLMVMMEVNYNEAYWDMVACSEWWMKLMMELIDDDERSE